MRSVSRKTFLNFVSLSLTGFYLTFCKNKSKIKYLYFSDKEATIIEKWSEAILPNTALDMPSVKEADVIQRLDEEFTFVSEDIQEEFHSAIFVLSYLPFFYGFWSTFENLSIEKRLEFLEIVSVTDSDIVRAVIGNLKLVTFLAYYGHKSTWNHIGYDGPFGNPPEKWSESRIYYKSTTGDKN